jgi:hypothetical protein
MPNSDAKRLKNQRLEQLVSTEERNMRRRYQQRQTPEGEYFDAQPSERVVLQRVYFINHEKSKHERVRYYLARNYEAREEIDAHRRAFVVLTLYYMPTISQHLPELL